MSYMQPYPQPQAHFYTHSHQSQQHASTSFLPIGAPIGAPPSANLWRDGHLSATLSSQGFKEYLNERLRAHPRLHPRERYRPDIRVWHFEDKFLVSSSELVGSITRPAFTFDLDGAPWWLLDYAVDPAQGVIVPQRLNDLRNPLPTLLKLSVPVFFRRRHISPLGVSFTLGISVADAARSSCPGIEDEERILDAVAGTTSTKFVLHWPGHSEYMKQTETRISSEPHTRGRFVYHIALFMYKFLREAPRLVDNRDAARDWLVDERWGHRLFIVGAVQVSKGRWQVIVRRSYD